MHQNLAMDVPLQDFTGDREQRDRSASDLFSGTTEDVFLALGSLLVVIERFNSLVSTGTILTAGEF